jgi:formylmethanofuran dehydrogenase subunit C
MPLVLRWREVTRLPVAAPGLSPQALAPLSPADLAKWPLMVGNAPAALADLFRIEGSSADGQLVLEGDFGQVRGIGSAMTAGTLTIRGDAGAELGAEMTGGTIEVHGSAGHWVGAGLRGGLIRIHGDVGHCLGAAYPGTRSGMREGVILVGGNAGEYVGLAMRRGLITIAGAAGDGLGRDLIAGSIFTFGAVGRQAGAGMKRGTLALFGLPDPADPDLLPTFTPSGSFRPHVLTIYLRRLRRWGLPVAETAFSGTLQRYNGDLAARGQGEVLIAT